MRTEDAPETAVELRGVTKAFRGQTAVRDLSLSIPHGSSFGFLGPNGAGKTTTLKMVLGLLRRDAGEIRVLGLDPRRKDLEVKRRVGYVPEQQFIYRWMRVREAIAFCRPLYPTWNDARCGELLKRFRLEPDKKVRHLSRGSVVKLALLLALSHEPEVLVLDEPMAGLDALLREELLDGVLRTLCEGSRTVIFSSHTIPDVQRLADRVGILDEGVLRVDSPVDELLKGTKRIRAVVANGSRPARAPEGTIWQRVAGREWVMTVGGFSADKVQRLRAENAVEHVEVLDLNLEEIFKDHIRGGRATS